MDEASLSTLQNEIAEIEQKLAIKKRKLEEAQAALEKQTADTTTTHELFSENTSQASLIEIGNHSPPEIKIALFRSLFKGRDDIYAKRFESRKSGKSGYQPACWNEWVRGICEKPRTRCGSCTQRSFEPVTDDVIRNHLMGSMVMGVYPLLPNETCHFLAIDFDKETWREDARAFMDTRPEIGLNSIKQMMKPNPGIRNQLFCQALMSRSLRRLK